MSIILMTVWNSLITVCLWKQTLIQQAPCQGKRLPTEDAIAEYIAGMLLLENDPVFYISYEEYTQQEAQTFTSFDVTDSKTE